MSQVLSLQRGIIYGPVKSRRLGRSLGINLSPTRRKFCPLDCLYCHYGRTRLHSTDVARYRDLFPISSAVVTALRGALATGINPAYVTFSGNGESTIHPDFPQIVKEVKPLVQKLAPKARLAILSNSVMVSSGEVVQALNELDVRIMKLDAGNAATFARINRPVPGVSFERIVKGLSGLREVTVQTLFAAGTYDNSSDADVADWLDCLRIIRPIEVQIYTCDRSPAEKKLKKVSRERLAEIAATASQQLGVPARAF